jgi:hypothetical protein
MLCTPAVRRRALGLTRRNATIAGRLNCYGAIMHMPNLPTISIHLVIGAALAGAPASVKAWLTRKGHTCGPDRLADLDRFPER